MDAGAGPSSAPQPSWQAGAADAHQLNAFLDFLPDDVLLQGDALDASTLTAVLAAQQQQQPGASPSGRPDSRNKRPLLQLDDGRDAEGGSFDDDDDEGEEDGDGGQARKGKRGKCNPVASNKANREKARRDRINDR